MAKRKNTFKKVEPRTKEKIKQLWLTGNFTLKDLSLEYNLSQGTISGIITKMFEQKETTTITLQSKINI